MAGRKRPKVVLCATLTADGKLDPDAPAVPLVLYRGGADPARHPWGEMYDAAAGLLLDLNVTEGLEASDEGMKPLATLHWPVLESCPPDQRRTQLLDAIRRLRGGFLRRVICFGGAGLFRELLEAGLMDELCLCVRPRIDGRRGTATLSGVGGDFFPASVACRLTKMEVAGDDCFLRYRVRQGAETAHKAS